MAVSSETPQQLINAEPRWARNLRFGFAAYALLGASVSLVGWALDVPGLTDWDASGISIQPNAAVAFFVASLASLLISLGYRKAALPLGILIATAGVLSVYQLQTGADLGFNTLFAFGREWGRVGAMAPGQVGMPASTSQALLGLAIMILSVTSSGKTPRLRTVALVLAIITACIAGLSLTGYFYGAETLYTIPRLTVIAFQTATFALAVSLALIFSIQDIGPGKLIAEHSAAGLMTRRVLPAIILLPMLLGFLRLTGEREGLYDLAFGTSVRTLTEIILLVALLGWTASAVSRLGKRAEQQERNLRRLADAMPQVVWIANVDGEVNYYNSRASSFAGIPPAAENLFDWRPELHPDDIEGTIAAWKQAVASQSTYEYEYRIKMTDGTYRWHLSRALRVSDGNGGHQWYGTATDIHDLKHAESLVRESEQRFSRFMHHLPGLAWIKDRAGRYIYVNEAAERAFGRARDELIGRTDDEVFPAETAELFKVNDREALASDAGIQVVEGMRNEKGELRESIVNKFPIPVADPDGPYIGGMAIDVTEQRRARLNEDFLFTIAEMIRVATDGYQLMTDISHAVGRHLGAHRCFFGEMDLDKQTTRIRDDYVRSGASVSGTYPVTEFSNQTFTELKSGQTVTNRDAEHDTRTAGRFDELYRPSGMISYVNVPLLRDGKWVGYLFCSDDKIRDWTAAEIALLESVAERTWTAVERTRAAAALRESEERFRLAQEAGNVGIWDWDIAAGRTYWSEQMWTLYDEPNSEIDPEIGFWNEHVHPDDQKRALDVFERSLASGDDHHADIFRVITKDGSVRWLESIATIERDPDGKPIRMYGVNLDITERQVAHDELEVRVVERTRELARTNSLLLRQMEERTLIEHQRVQLLKRVFTVQEDERSRIARDIHDHLGQRLTALRLKIASVRALCEHDPVVVQRVNRLQEISETLDKEVSFLAWELRPEILDQTDFVHALEQYVHEWSRHSEVFAEFTVIGVRDKDFDKDIKNNLYRITQEALNNAAKYSQATQLNVILEQRGSGLILIIEDNGVGFEPGPANGDGMRKGFGLVGMRERATLIGGTLEIESAPERGTTVFVRVPIAGGK